MDVKSEPLTPIFIKIEKGVVFVLTIFFLRQIHITESLQVDSYSILFHCQNVIHVLHAYALKLKLGLLILSALGFVHKVILPMASKKTYDEV